MRHSWATKRTREMRYRDLSIGGAVGLLDKQSNEATAYWAVYSLEHGDALCTLLTAETRKSKLSPLDSPTPFLLRDNLEQRTPVWMEM